MIMIIAIIYLFLYYVLFDEQLKIISQLFDQNHIPLFYSLSP